MKLLLPLTTLLLPLTLASPFPTTDFSTASLYPKYNTLYIERTPPTFTPSSFLGPSTDQSPSSPLTLLSAGKNLVHCYPLDPSIPAQGIYRSIDSACTLFRAHAFHTKRGFSYSFKLEASHDGRKTHDLVFSLHNPITARESDQLFQKSMCIDLLRQAQQICVDKFERVHGRGRRLPRAIMVTINQDRAVVYDLILTVRLQER